MRSNSQQIVSYYLGLCTQNPGLREVGMELSSLRGSDKIYVRKPRRNTHNKKASSILQPGLTYGSRKVEWDWEASDKTGTNRTGAPVSFY